MTAAPRFPHLAKPVKIGAIQARNAVFMASLTRNRSLPDTVANDDNVKYYEQRARENGGAGLIFTEGTLITPQGTEWPYAPGIWDDEHVAGWKKVVDAVHAHGTPIVAQLWHLGRVSHPDMPEQKKAGVPVYGPSAVSARGHEGKFRTLPGKPGYVTPVAIPDPTVILDQYERAAELAKKAGFDGVEFHSANGYLSEQFLSDISNIRTDQWGGSVENRTRFGLEALKRLIKVYGADRVGIKITPAGGYNDSYFTTKESLLETFHYYVSEINKLNLAWVQLAQYFSFGDPHLGGKPQGYDHDVVAEYGPQITNSAIIVNTNYDAESAEKELKERGATAVTFGRNWIASPDYYKRLQEGIKLNEPDFHTFYVGGNGIVGNGYYDYPFSD